MESPSDDVWFADDGPADTLSVLIVSELVTSCPSLVLVMVEILVEVDLVMRLSELRVA